MSNLKKQALNGVKWTTISMGIKSILQIIQLIVLARFLSAEDFGLVAIVMIVVGFSQLFMDMGISNAIIHKQEISSEQLSSLYWLNIFSGLFLTILVYFSSYSIASFYNEKAIIPMLKILSFSFLINAVGNQYRVLLRKELRFNILAKVEILAIIVSFICAIWLAVKGYGAYSLVYATLLNALISNIMLLYLGLKMHKPKFIFKLKNIKSFLTFGLYQMGQKTIVYFNNQFDVILIGKLLGTEAVGIYSLTKQLVMRPSQIINPIIMNVTFPVMSKVQNDLSRLKSIYLKIINYLASINFPIYLLMAVLAEFIVPLILGEKWINVVPIFQVLSIYAMIRSIASPAGSLLLAKGRADIGLWWSLGELIFMPLIIYVSSSWGLIGIAVGLLVFQLIMIFPTWYFVIRKFIDATISEYFGIQIKLLLFTIISIIPILVINNFPKAIVSISFFLIYFFITYYYNKDFIKDIKALLLKG